MFPNFYYTWLGFAFYTLVAVLQVQAGEGATFVLMNATPYTWTLSSTSSYQMNDWSFPSSIASGTFAKVYVEWDQNIFDDESDDGGEAVYALSGTSYTFQLQARAPNGVFHLQAYLNGISTAGNPLGSTIDLGWLHDQNNLFVLSGNSSFFSSNNPPSNWMQASLPIIGGRLIRELCIPGSHDAGMSFLNGSTLFANELNTLTQTVPIYNQLVFGARYFDIRPVKSSGIYKSGHYSNTVVDGWQTPVGWQGGNGQSIASIISDINSFTQGNSELIFIKLSHDLDSDGDYSSLTQTQWNTLLTQLQGINHLYIASPTVDFTRLSLRSLIQNGPAVVVLVAPGDQHVNILPFQGQGFYWANVSLPVYDNYTGTNNLGTMMTDQIQKLTTQRPTPDSPMFLLSWTLTMSAVTAAAVGGTIPPLRAGEPTIVGYAAQANNALSTGLFPSVSTHVFPNILYVDNFASSNITAVVMAVNAISQNFNVVPPSQPWTQCGGIGWTGATTCVANYVCTYSNQFYSQCLPA